MPRPSQLWIPRWGILRLRSREAGQLDLTLRLSSLAVPLSVPGFRKLPGFRGPVDLETWRLERGYGYRGQAEMVGPCQEGCGTAELGKGAEAISLKPNSGSRH